MDAAGETRFPSRCAPRDDKLGTREGCHDPATGHTWPPSEVEREKDGQEQAASARNRQLLLALWPTAKPVGATKLVVAKGAPGQRSWYSG